jgi:hypothetical protein
LTASARDSQGAFSFLSRHHVANPMFGVGKGAHANKYKTTH